ncbi:hypothetical protein L204_103640 [Cryptococcus depauperatus]|nr:hypothetical protein L204_01958 [Cryptococcus depauperatus CBS 7855]
MALNALADTSPAKAFTIGITAFGKQQNASNKAMPPLHTPNSGHIIRRTISTPSVAFSDPPKVSCLSEPSSNSYAVKMTDSARHNPSFVIPPSSVPRANVGRKFPSSFSSPTPHGSYSSTTRMETIKGTNSIEMGELAGIQPPPNFPLSEYPAAYIRQDSVPMEDNEEHPMGRQAIDGSLKRSRQSAPSCNPWDYLVADAVPESQLHYLQSKAGYGPDANHGCKVRRRFTKRELESLEVLWSISKSPSKYERQRLGAWLGVKTKHITVWFQNRRQEEKRYTRDGQNENPPPSRSNRGTFDPVTGKWRPVPASCISGLQPPPEDKVAVIRAISLGDVTRDMWLAKHPPLDKAATAISWTSSILDSANGGGVFNTGRTVKDPIAPFSVRSPAKSLDALLLERESGFGSRDKQYRQTPGDVILKGEGQERIREMLAMMPSDPPSMGPEEIEGEESEGGDGGIDEDAVKKQARQLISRPRSVLGRATSHDVLASSSRAKLLTKLPTTSLARSVLGPINSSLQNISPALPHLNSNLRKHTLDSVAQSRPTKRRRSRASDTHSTLGDQVHSRNKGFARSISTSAIKSSHSLTLENNDHASQPSQLKTPKLGSKRSQSISSGSSQVITPEDSKGNRRKVRSVPARQKGSHEKDEEVLGAAEMLLQMLGGPST